MRVRVTGCVILTLMGVISEPALADVWVTNLTPVSVETALDGSGAQYVSVTVSGSATSPAGCPATDAYLSYSIPNSTLAVLLSAVSLQKTVNIYVSSSSCSAGRPSFSHILLQN